MLVIFTEKAASVVPVIFVIRKYCGGFVPCIHCLSVDFSAFLAFPYVLEKLGFYGDTGMSIRQAELPDLDTVKNIAEMTISEIYPHYYPKGAVEFFLAHHHRDQILKDIEKNRVFLCFDISKNAVGTVTIKENEICRLFVLPPCQRMGYGREMLDFAEEAIAGRYSKILLDASLPAKKMYLKRGYRSTEFQIIPTAGGDFLCYDIMEKHV